MQIFKDFEEQAHDNGYDSCEYHALNSESTERNFCAGQADNHDDGSHYEVRRFAVIDFLFYEYADTGRSDYAEQQHADAAHDRNGDTVNEFAELAAEGEQDRHDCCAADNPGAVNFGDGHNANVFTISSVRSCAGEAADDVGETIGKQRTGKTGVFDEVTFDDVAGDHKVTDMFCKDDKGCRSDNHNRAEVEDWRIEMRNLKPRSVDNGLEVDHAHDGSKYVTADNTEKNRNDAQEAAEGNRTNDADSKREH